MDNLRRATLSLALLFLTLVNAEAREFRFPAKAEGGAVSETSETSFSDARDITIYSNADIDIVQGVIADFQQLYPGVTVIYHDLQSIELYERIQEETSRGGDTADLAISSAMDLQMKLVNDGFAQPVNIPTAAEMPHWAVWRNEAYGVTYEPAVIVYNKPYFADHPLPKTRAELINFLEQRPADLFGRIATYDIERSGLGFLFLATDSEQYSATWNMVRSLGLNGVKLFSSSASIIDRVGSGRFVLGYNVLGSYALARVAENPDLGVLLPKDYTIVFSRIAMVPKAARSIRAGQLFLNYLLSERGQRTMVQTAHFDALHPAVQGPFSAQGLLSKSSGNLRPIKVSPGLLVYLDQAKRSKILRKWNQALRGE